MTDKTSPEIYDRRLPYDGEKIMGGKVILEREELLRASAELRDGGAGRLHERCFDVLPSDTAFSSRRGEGDALWGDKRDGSVRA